MLIHGTDGNGAPTDAGDGGHGDGGGSHDEMHAEGAMKPRTLFSVIVLASLATAAALTLPAILKQEVTTGWCSYRPIPEPPIGSKIAVATFLANASGREQ